MRMTSRKKEILSCFEPDNLEGSLVRSAHCHWMYPVWPTVLHGMGSFGKRHQLEST
ncbi:hypothetical protein [Lonsdalea quercina]|uniref:hypothetical protein n=1 Tax=Lonsdalea quercina TaxID=71657 RepID=UPI0039768534